MEKFSKEEIETANYIFNKVIDYGTDMDKCLYLAGEIRMYVEMKDELEKLKQENEFLKNKLFNSNNSNAIGYKQALEDYVKNLPFTNPKIK